MNWDAVLAAALTMILLGVFATTMYVLWASLNTPQQKVTFLTIVLGILFISLIVGAIA